jgi:hypothetical protein
LASVLRRRARALQLRDGHCQAGDSWIALPQLRPAQPPRPYRALPCPADDTLTDLAGTIGLDRERFSAEIASDAVDEQLREEVAFARRAPILGFPSLAVGTESGLQSVDIDYRDANAMYKQIEAILTATGAG